MIEIISAILSAISGVSAFLCAFCVILLAISLREDWREIGDIPAKYKREILLKQDLRCSDNKALLKWILQTLIGALLCFIGSRIILTI
jgi:hypothetical protein